ncbi:MAG TPA: flagellar motor protein MotA [Alphaproteobacteria bacterium]|jgi:membrane associated rhomboid family serine protease
MSSPQNYLTRMAIFLVFVLAACGALAGVLRAAFLHNPYLNTLILGVAALGIVLIFRQVILLKSEAAWLESWRKERRLAPASNTRPLPPAPRRLAPIASLLAERRSRISLSPMALRSLLDGIALRLDESREIARYMTAVLIFLGLLGTFWGLIKTIGSIADVIAALDVGSGNAADVFANLKAGLSAPLSGMGTAFSSSLFGLAGSLVLGFLDLQAGQAQNRFYNELEETLSAQTRISSGNSPVGEGDASVPAYVQALLEQTAESLEGLQRIMGRGEESRTAANVANMQLNEKLSTLTDQMRAEQSLMIKLAESQMELKPVLARLADSGERREGALDDATRGHIRNIEVYLARMLEEMSQGRSQTVEEIRSEIKILSRTIAALPRDSMARDAMARDKTPPQVR